MPVLPPVADRDHDLRRFAGLQYGDDLIGLGAFEVRFDELVAAALRRLQDWNVALLPPLLQPLLKVIGNAMQRPWLTGYKCRSSKNPSTLSAAETAELIR